MHQLRRLDNNVDVARVFKLCLVSFFKLNTVFSSTGISKKESLLYRYSRQIVIVNRTRILKID